MLTVWHVSLFVNTGKTPFGVENPTQLNRQAGMTRRRFPLIGFTSFLVTVRDWTAAQSQAVDRNNYWHLASVFIHFDAI